jgi:hypothetical protein
MLLIVAGEFGDGSRSTAKWEGSPVREHFKFKFVGYNERRRRIKTSRISGEWHWNGERLELGFPIGSYGGI